MRVLRLCLGIFCAVQAIENYDAVSGFIAAFFLFQAVTNIGCCGTAACAAPPVKQENENSEEVVFEEIKVKN